jgi:hypothetical protein
MASKAGGGINSRNVKSVSVRTGSAARAQSPRGVSQIGQNLGNHSTDNSGKKLTKSVEPVRGAAISSVKLGNEVAASTVCGPGGSRTVMRSGGQGMHGAPAQGNPPPAGELFPGWPSKPRT